MEGAGHQACRGQAGRGASRSTKTDILYFICCCGVQSTSVPAYMRCIPPHPPQSRARSCSLGRFCQGGQALLVAPDSSARRLVTAPRGGTTLGHVPPPPPLSLDRAILTGRHIPRAYPFHCPPHSSLSSLARTACGRHAPFAAHPVPAAEPSQDSPPPP